MFSASSPLCWRKCGQVGTLLHVWWLCSLIPFFWSEVSDIIVELTNYSLTLSPDLEILDISLDNIPYHFRTIIHLVLLAARTTIAKHWKQPVTTPLAELIRRINFSCHSELTLTPLNPSSPYKDDLWSYWSLNTFHRRRWSCRCWVLFWFLINYNQPFINPWFMDGP